ncbi:hypothetical protein ACFLQN_00385 [Candidatus Aenigmatarchaeota archaeon]
MKFMIIAITIASILLISGCTTQPNNDENSAARSAMEIGWLFDIDSGEKYFVSIGYYQNIMDKVYTQEEIIQLSGSLEPTITHTQEEWLASCEELQLQMYVRECSEEGWQTECSGSNEKPCLSSFEYWQSMCESANARARSCMDHQYWYYEPILIQYMEENGIEGEIIDAVVAYFPITGTGLHPGTYGDNRIYCQEDQRGVGACTMDYTPVCGFSDDGSETYSNGCVACTNENVNYYIPGEC